MVMYITWMLSLCMIDRMVMEGRFVMMRDFGGWDMSGGGCRACEVWNMWV